MKRSATQPNLKIQAIDRFIKSRQYSYNLRNANLPKFDYNTDVDEIDHAHILPECDYCEKLWSVGHNLFDQKYKDNEKLISLITEKYKLYDDNLLIVCM